MSNFSPKLEDATDEQLMHMVNELNFRVVPLASDELTRRSIKKLQETIQTFNKQSSKQTDKMILLTWLIVSLTIIMVVGLVIQIILVFTENKSQAAAAPLSDITPIVQAVVPPPEGYEWCDNENEIQEFATPIPVVWEAKFLGCLVSCDGASFKNLSDSAEYAYFAGYGPSVKAAIGDFWDREGWLDDSMHIKIYGKWVGIDADHPKTVFGNKCVPIVDIEKIEKL